VDILLCAVFSTVGTVCNSVIGAICEDEALAVERKGICVVKHYLVWIAVLDERASTAGDLGEARERPAYTKKTVATPTVIIK
jgi:hypothetical protein